MKDLKPWAKGPFELIHHAEGHFNKEPSGLDLRMALISFDNSIEQSIVTYLGLNPIQRKNRILKKEDVKKWQNNFHTKLEFFEHFVVEILKMEMKVGRDEIIYFHNIRNELYHGGNGLVPDIGIVKGIRGTAIWIFSVLFELKLEDIYSRLENDSNYSVKDVDEVEFSKETELLKKMIELKTKVNTANTIEDVEFFSFDKIQIKYNNVLSLYNKIKKSILDGEELAEDEDQTLEKLNGEIENISDYIDFQFRTHQEKIADLALEKTLSSIFENNNRRIGHIYQIQGSGRYGTMLLFLVKAILNKKLEQWKFIIVADRSDIIDQTFHFIVEKSKIQSEVEVVKSSEQLENLFRDSSSKVALVTQQRLLQEGIEKTISANKILIITTGLINRITDLEKIFLNAHLIHFIDAPSSYYEDNSIGEAISVYDFHDAINDGDTLPIIYEKRNLPDSTSVEKLKRDHDLGLLINSDLLTKIAKDIILHFEEKRKINKGKALIIVSDIEKGEKLKKEFFTQRPDWKKNGVIDLISSQKHPAERSMIIHKFKSESDQLSLIIGINLWVGLHNPLIDTLYLVRKLSGPTLFQALTRVNRLHPGKKNGLIVDYFDNEEAIQRIIKTMEK